EPDASTSGHPYRLSGRKQHWRRAKLLRQAVIETALTPLKRYGWPVVTIEPFGPSMTFFRTVEQLGDGFLNRQQPSVMGRKARFGGRWVATRAALSKCTQARHPHRAGS